MLIKYKVMYVPTKEVIDRVLEVELSEREAMYYLNMKLAEWNRQSPGLWQYYT